MELWTPQGPSLVLEILTPGGQNSKDVIRCETAVVKQFQWWIHKDGQIPRSRKTRTIRLDPTLKDIDGQRSLKF